MSYQLDRYGRYDIKSGMMTGQWHANAFRHKALVAKSAGTSRDEAVAAVKAKLDEIDSLEISERDNEGAPSEKIYADAFELILPKISDSYRAMLKAHFEAPNQLITATELAQAAGYNGYEAANLHYGMLSKRIALEIGFDPPKREDGTEIWTCAIARGPSQDHEFPDTSILDAMMRAIGHKHFEWQLRPQVVRALNRIDF